MLLGNEDSKIIADQNEPSIKHPMHRSGQSQAIANGVRTFRCHRLNVRRLNLETPSTIDQFQTCNRASIRIGRADIMHKGFFSEGSRDDHFDHWSLERRSRFRKPRRRSFRRKSFAKNRSKSRLQYPVELTIRNDGHSSTERTLIGGTSILSEIPLVVYTALLKRDGRIKIQIGCSINVCKIVTCQSGVFGHRRDPRDTKIGLATSAA